MTYIEERRFEKIKRLSNKWLQASACLVLATVLGLTSHIYIQEWTQPILDTMKHGIVAENSTYPPVVIAAAYLTGILTVAMKVFVYYHTQNLLPIKSIFLKLLAVTAILLELKGELIRIPLMNILLNYNLGMSNPFIFGVFASLDQWVASFLTAVCLVYLCPKKQ
jgi:hypothetical protein